MGLAVLPKFVALQSKPTGKYLRYVEEDGEVHGYVQFSAEDVASPDAKFEVHVSKSGNGLVHLRSCYNNKYLVVNEEGVKWNVAKAQQQEEDKSKKSCTLLKPTSVDGDPKKIRLTNVYLGNNLCLWTCAQPYYGCVLAGYSTPDGGSFDVFNVIDWQSLVILPKYVAFKGDNSNYLRALWTENHEYLQFSLADATQNPELAGNEIIRNPDGTIRVKNLYWGKFWRRSPNWIWADSTDTTTNNKDTLFEPIKYNDNTIALRNLGNNLFCARLTTEGKTSCLNANSSTINQWARLEVSEHIVSRKIQNINFRLMDSRIYGDQILTMASATAVNKTQSTNQVTLDLTHTETRISTWNASVSLKLGAKATFDVGLPLIFEGKIEISAEIAGQYAWGETKQTTDTVATKYNATVPPMTKVTARMVATQGSCDVPFSYTQRDVLYDGKTVTTDKDDGVYTGINSYSAYIEVKEEPVSNQSTVAPAQFKRVAKVSPAAFKRVAPIPNC